MGSGGFDDADVGVGEDLDQCHQGAIPFVRAEPGKRNADVVEPGRGRHDVEVIVDGEHVAGHASFDARLRVVADAAAGHLDEDTGDHEVTGAVGVDVDLHHAAELGVVVDVVTEVDRTELLDLTVTSGSLAGEERIDGTIDRLRLVPDEGGLRRTGVGEPQPEASEHDHDGRDHTHLDPLAAGLRHDAGGLGFGGVVVVGHDFSVSSRHQPGAGGCWLPRTGISDLKLLLRAKILSQR